MEPITASARALLRELDGLRDTARVNAAAERMREVLAAKDEPERSTIGGIDSELRVLSCGDNSCAIARPSGMATNGGCQCSIGGKGDMDRDTARLLRTAFKLYRSKASLLETDNARLTLLLQQREVELTAAHGALASMTARLTRHEGADQ